MTFYLLVFIMSQILSHFIHGNREDYEILLNTLPGKVEPPRYAVKLLEDTCARTGLDWKLRHVYLMSRGGKWGVTLSIDGFRLIGSQDPDYAGQSGPFWVSSPDGEWTDIPPDGKIYAAKVGILHRGGQITYGVAKYADYKAGPMWDKFPSTMTAKCAEMLAWRKTFPETFGGLYGDAEMQQTERTATPKAALKAVEVIGEAEPETPPTTEVNYPKYLNRLNEALNLPDLTQIGQEIKADKTLAVNEVLELHKVYTNKRKEFSNG